MSQNFRTVAEASAAFAAHRPELEARGIHLHEDTKSYLTVDMQRNYKVAMDAVPNLITQPNTGIPAMLTTFYDPKSIEVLFAPLSATRIAPERKVGDWTTDEFIFSIIEHTFEVSAYGDYLGNGRAGINANFPSRTLHRFQIMKEYGDLAMDKAAKANINLPVEIDRAASAGLNRFSNTIYFKGVTGIANYGLLTDPALASSLTPGVKAAGNGNVWIYNNAPNATANEIFADVQALVIRAITLSGGLVDNESDMTLGMAPVDMGALTTTNNFGISAMDLIKKNYPNLEIVTAIQYGALGTGNPDGLAAGNMLQLVVNEVEGQQAVESIYAEKMRNHGVVRQVSSVQQKVTAAAFGALIRVPVLVQSMVGV